jgi:hypothetical protein
MKPLRLVSPRIQNKSRLSLVGARFIVPLSPRHAVPVLAWRADEFPDFCSSLLSVSALPSTHDTKSRIKLRRSDLECGSSAAAFPNDTHDSMFGILKKLCQAARDASVSASTSTPRAMSSGDAYSSGRWLYPPRQGINSIATGATRDIKSES